MPFFYFRMNSFVFGTNKVPKNYLQSAFMAQLRTTTNLAHLWVAIGTSGLVEHAYYGENHRESSKKKEMQTLCEMQKGVTG